MRIHRLIAILLTIESKDVVKAKELAERLETSTRTIYRDIDTLCEAGFPLTTSTGPSGGISFMPNYKLNLKNIHEEDIVSLFLGGMGVKLGPKGLNAFLKLDKAIDPSLKEELQVVNKHFYLDEDSWWDEDRHRFDPDLIIEAVRGHFKLNIHYVNKDGKTSNRILQPYGVVVSEGEWYVVGLCEKAEEIRTFKCCRMIRCHLCKSTFEAPANFDLEAHWKLQKAAFIKACKETES